MIRLIKTLKILPRWIIVIIDLSMVTISSSLAYLLRFNFELEQLAQFKFFNGLTLFLGCYLVATLITRSYSGIIRYTGLKDSIRVLSSIALSIFLIVVINVIYYYNFHKNYIPYSVVLISFFTSYIFLFFYRIAVKYVFTYYNNALSKKERIMIFGAGQLGVITKQVIESDTYNGQKVVGFLEDNIRKTGKLLNGTAIYDAKLEFERMAKEQRVAEIIIAIKNLSLNRKNEIVDLCLKLGIRVSTVPPVEKWVKGELSLKQIKEVRIEDLLGRETIQLDNELLNKELVNRTILVTGAAGSIGSEIVRQVMMYGPRSIVMVDQAESPLYEIERQVNSINRTGISVISRVLDITNKQNLESIFETYGPSVVFHAAAYKHVPMMENNPKEAVLCNILGTKYVADLSVKHKVEKFVMISTDKAVNPTNVMGCTKRIAEIYVQALNNHIRHSDTSSTSFVTTRFGNVLGSNGSVIPYFKKQIAAGGPVTVTHPEITRYFMTIPEACQLVLEAGAMGKGGEIFIFDMGESIRIVELAKKMIRLSGMQLGRDIEIVYTGLREGEKLYEELLNVSENSIPTHHEKIMIAKVEEKSFEIANEDINGLERILEEQDDMKLVSHMKKIVPEFISNSSRFELLDS